MVQGPFLLRGFIFSSVIGLRWGKHRCGLAIVDPVDALKNTNQAKPAHKRLSIELASTRQSLWRIPGEAEGGHWMHDKKPKDVTDCVRWVNTNVMLAESLTKVMVRPIGVNSLESTLQSGRDLYTWETTWRSWSL